MSLFNEALEETRRARVTQRARNLMLSAVGFVVLGAMFYVFSNIDRQLERASSVDSDNITWSVAQVEVDTLKLQRAVIHAIAHPQDPDRLKNLRLLFDIFYSRFNMMARSDQMATLPINDELRNELWNSGAFFDRITPLIDGDDATLVAALPALEAEMDQIANDVRRHVVSSLQQLIATGGVRRDELRVSLQGFAAAGLGFMGILAGFALVIVMQSRAQQRRSETTERAVHNLRATIENSLDSVIIADNYGTIIDCNRSAEALFGLLRTEAQGRRLADLLSKDGFDDPLSALHHAATGGTAAMIEGGRIRMTGRQRSGHDVPVEVALTEAKGASGDPMSIAFVRDISERIEREESLRRARNDALQGEEAKSRFLAMMSHEMRTPLNGLIAATELLQNSTPLDQRQSWLSEIVLSCGWAALDQVNNVLELTRLGGDQTGTYPHSVFSPVQVIRDLLLQSQPQAAKRGNLLSFDEPETAVPLVSAPRQLFLRVLYNLIGNAIKFTDGGTVTITLKTQHHAGSLRLVVSVIDTGIGIDEGNLERVFHNFETLDSSYARMREGTGLGLGIAKLAAEAMGGEIHVSSKLGEGSTFTLDVTLPVAEGQIEAAPTGISALGEGNALSILVVEDNPINSLLLTEMLRLRGHAVTNAVDGIEAVEAATATTFDLILMDISMPRMDGLEATRRIRAGGASSGVPIIGVTANAAPDKLPEFLGSGMTDVLVKPITRGSLMNIIEEHIAAKPKPTPDALARPSVLDAKVFAETLADMGRDFVQTLATRLLQETNTTVDTIRELATEGRYREAAAAAHKTAGAAAAIGLSGLHGTLAAYESAALGGDADSAHRCLADIPGMLTRTTRALAEHGLALDLHTA
ncbi:hybrid sensor histidine kinase/response regulator [Gemmobacter aquarius]|uniref:histidine kinase n=1 Tax=Paragemmobacter aquarius TaxID=2169400 RepID=A0A2S0UPD3_9RHOB|nr:ATP-binding protein [Gemmobacter aquarius]AWB49650.1 hybrid sensor histidine kinase/response regulator [Gemmobacter aquarius]